VSGLADRASIAAPVPRGSGKEAATSLGSGCLGQGYQRFERDYWCGNRKL